MTLEVNSYEVNDCCNLARLVHFFHFVLFYIRDDPSIIENLRKKSESIKETHNADTCQMKSGHKQVEVPQYFYDIRT